LPKNPLIYWPTGLNKDSQVPCTLIAPLWKIDAPPTTMLGSGLTAQQGLICQADTVGREIRPLRKKPVRLFCSFRRNRTTSADASLFSPTHADHRKPPKRAKPPMINGFSRSLLMHFRNSNGA
jgi:hypothetical protein